MRIAIAHSCYSSHLPNGNGHVAEPCSWDAVLPSPGRVSRAGHLVSILQTIPHGCADLSPEHLVTARSEICGHARIEQKPPTVNLTRLAELSQGNNLKRMFTNKSEGS
jgi:hypothetical protein